MNARASDVVFAGTVMRVERPLPWSRGDPDGSVTLGDFGGRPTSARFDVDRVFVGRESRQIVVTLDGANCDVPFKSGQVWLVYASERDGAIRTSKCTRTRLREEAAQDLEYFEGRERQRPQGILFGLVLRRGLDADGQPALKALLEPLEVVAMRGGQRFVARTDAGGPFQIVLPPGEFELSVERQGQLVSPRQAVRVDADAEQRLMLVASY